MPVARTTPLRQQRARTGCLSCRKRRRKCDETKPECLNCVARNVTCIYPGADFRFPTFNTNSAEDDGATGPSASHRKFTFVNQSTSIVVQRSHQNQPSSDTSAPAVRNDELDALEPAPVVSPEGQSVRSSQTGGSSTRLDRYPKSMSVSLHPSEDDSASDAKSLIQHFCYSTAPWIEAGSTKAQFANYAIRLAQDRPAIMSAIFALSSTQMGRYNDFENTSLLDYSGSNGQRLYSAGLNDQSDRIYQGLMTLIAFLECGPRQWLSLRPKIITEVEGNEGDLKEPLRTLAQMHSRLDLGISIIDGSIPLTNAMFYHNASGSTTQITELPEIAQRQSLAYLTSCLHLIHGDRRAADQIANSDPISNLAAGNFSSQWFSLWTDCQTWFNTRNRATQPVLDVRSIEASKLDPSNSSSFPIQIFTNVAALQSNVIYHLTCILLLVHKPRLLKLAARDQQFVTSQGWHSQQIAGIAMSNDFAEQWDPIFIVALLHIAKAMTHRAQQQALVSRFRSIMAATGIRLNDEMNRLQSEWDLVRYDGAAGGN